MNEVDISIERISSIERLEQCTELFLEAYNCEPWNDKWTKEIVLELFNCYYRTPDFLGWLALSGSQIIGCCIGNSEPYYTGKIFYLRDLFITVKFQQAGVGRRLIAAMKHDAGISGINTVVLFTNKQTSDFYIKSGFKKMEGMEMMISEKE
jgi:aminoglycoside 6'-N-acetyltransferase I